MKTKFRLADWEVCPSLNQVQRGDEVRRLEPKVMDLLVYLARHPGEVHSREHILQAVWPDAFVTDQVLTNAIAEIRKVLDDIASAPTFIQTVPRRGYVLIAAVVQDAETEEEREIPASITRKSAKVIALGLIVIVAAAGLLWFLVSRRTAQDVPKISNSVIVVAFENQTGDARFDHLRKVIPDLLITSLENTGGFQVTTWERARDLLRQSGQGDVSLIDPESGFELCRRERVRALVTGSVTKAGNAFVTNLRVLDAESRRMLRSAIWKSILLHLTGRVRQSREALKTAQELTTATDPSRFADYVEGWLELDESNFEKSRAAFRRCRETGQKLDGARPADQLRWSLCEAFLATAEGNAGGAKAAFSSAERILTSLNPDQRRFYDSLAHLIRARISTADGDAQAALIRLTRTWPGPNPGVKTAAYISYCLPLAADDLARMYASRRDWDRSIAEYKVLTVIGSQHGNRRPVHPIYHYRLAQIYERRGQSNEAATEYERFLKLWENADPARPEIASARSRLEALRKRL
jgi:DNA-binding winged helix-turn-helix (wHTH) protein/TolB-like protein